MRLHSLRSRFVISVVDSNLLSSSSSAAAYMMVSRQKMTAESKGIADIRPTDRLRMIRKIDREQQRTALGRRQPDIMEVAHVADASREVSAEEIQGTGSSYSLSSRRGRGGKQGVPVPWENGYQQLGDQQPLACMGIGRLVDLPEKCFKSTQHYANLWLLVTKLPVPIVSWLWPSCVSFKLSSREGGGTK